MCMHPPTYWYLQLNHSWNWISYRAGKIHQSIATYKYNSCKKLTIEISWWDCRLWCYCGQGIVLIRFDICNCTSTCNWFGWPRCIIWCACMYFSHNYSSNKHADCMIVSLSACLDMHVKLGSIQQHAVAIIVYTAIITVYKEYYDNLTWQQIIKL